MAPAKKRRFPGLAFGTAGLVAFLMLWEGEEQFTVYADQLAGGIPTVCEGLTRHVTDTPIIVGEVWPAAKCKAERDKALHKLQTSLEGCFVIQPPQSVFDGATSHAWNLGVANTCGSAAMKAWGRGDWTLGCKRIARADDGRRVWSFVKTGRKLANGKPEYRFIQGLANRRDAEREFCLTDVAKAA